MNIILVCNCGVGLGFASWDVNLMELRVAFALTGDRKRFHSCRKMKKWLNGSIGEEDRDFIHVLLSSLDGGKVSADDTEETAIMGTWLVKRRGKALIITVTTNSIREKGNKGIEIKSTSSIESGRKFSRNPYMTLVTLTWALSLILNSREVLGMAQDELDTQVGKHWQVDEIDIKNLVYFPAAPLSAPRQAMEDCTVLHLTLVRLVHGFEMGTVSDTLIDMSELKMVFHIWVQFFRMLKFTEAEEKGSTKLESIMEVCDLKILAPSSFCNSQHYLMV
ncbi:hypothetical protein DKX38_006233 [Salix brachista]|uniref:Uncharacterized protein n=1 Tax=Salix brachista TaxID=2182728 RepID=A0A5N5N4U6_9ROSI|nr:hypothetical protein DKX38_006233 [Salix brachista]